MCLGRYKIPGSEIITFSKDGKGVGLVWYWYSVAKFFDYGQDLFEFSEVPQHGYASLGYGVDDSALAYVALFNELLFDEEVQVLLEDTAVNVSLVHDVSKLEWATVG
jgi:hypothetical protein